MALRLMPRSPRRRIRLVTVIGGLRFCASGWARNTSADLTPATGARTTRFCRTIQRPSSAAPVVRSRVLELALRSRLRADAAASTASHPNVFDDPDTPLAGDETAGFLVLIWEKRQEEYFLKKALTGQIPLIALGKFSLQAHRRESGQSTNLMPNIRPLRQTTSQGWRF